MREKHITGKKKQRERSNQGIAVWGLLEAQGSVRTERELSTDPARGTTSRQAKEKSGERGSQQFSHTKSATRVAGSEQTSSGGKKRGLVDVCKETEFSEGVHLKRGKKEEGGYRKDCTTINQEAAKTKKEVQP